MGLTADGGEPVGLEEQREDPVVPGLSEQRTRPADHLATIRSLLDGEALLPVLAADA